MTSNSQLWISSIKNSFETNSSFTRFVILMIKVHDDHRHQSCYRIYLLEEYICFMLYYIYRDGHTKPLLYFTSSSHQTSLNMISLYTVLVLSSLAPIPGATRPTPPPFPVDQMDSVRGLLNFTEQE